jgi:thioredoxin-related protein
MKKTLSLSLLMFTISLSAMTSDQEQQALINIHACSSRIEPTTIWCMYCAKEVMEKGPETGLSNQEMLNLCIDFQSSPKNFIYPLTSLFEVF